MELHFYKTDSLLFQDAYRSHTPAPEVTTLYGISFFQKTVRILPHQRQEQIAGEKLPVVRMTAKDQISTWHPQEAKVLLADGR